MLSIFILGKHLEYIKQWQKENKERRIKLSVFFNAETDRCYQNAFLTVFCKENNVDLYFMGRLIRKQFEQTFQQLLADYRIEIKRLNFYITKFDSNKI